MNWKQKRREVIAGLKALIAVGAAAALISGCVSIDYKVFKAKYPNAGILDYVWSKGK